TGEPLVHGIFGYHWLIYTMETLPYTTSWRTVGVGGFVAMAFCSNCGKSVTGAFCVNCGSQVNAAAASTAPGVPPSQPQAAAPRKGVSPIVWILGIIAGIF